jgi:hypothetical protein
VLAGGLARVGVPDFGAKVDIKEEKRQSFLKKQTK